MTEFRTDTTAGGRWRGLVVLVAVFALLLAACGDDDGDADGPGENGAPTTEPAGNGGDDGEPRRGGEVVIAETFALSLDPAVAPPFGCCGGNALAALYDTIVAFNWDTREYEMRTAESLDSNDDLSEWTLTLKPDITFTDGTAYDAEAVAMNVERHREMPTSQEFARLRANLDEIEVVDDLTVVFHLTSGWGEFPSVLAGGAGMIASPAVIEAHGEDFGQQVGDMGAGPFTVVNFIANERVELERNEDFYGGEVYLDRLVSVATPQAQSPVDSITGGTIHGGATVEWTHVEEAGELGYPAVEMLYPSGQVILMNSGTYECSGGVPAGVCDGQADGTMVEMDTATADPRVRQAVLHAIDRDLWNDRWYDGTAVMTDRVFSESFSYSPDVESPTYDPEEAQRLVEEAKADGWDGVIRLVGEDSPLQTTGQQTFVAMLEAVGMDPVLDLRSSSEYRQVVQNDRDFDVYGGIWGIGNSEDRFLSSIAYYVTDHSFGYDSSELNAAIAEARVASTDDEILAAWTQIAEIISEDSPVGFVGDAPRHFIHSPDLKGLATTGNTIVLFDKAWLDD